MAIDFSRVRALCFDVDGTLSNTDDQFVQKLAHYLSPLKYFFPQRNVHPIARRLIMFTEGPGNWVYTLADRVGLDNTIISLGDRLYDRGCGEKTDPFLIIEGVREMLAVLNNHYPMSIISARGQKSTYRFLFQYELIPYFRAVATGQSCPHTKPFRDPVDWVAEKMGVPPSACLVIGDTVVDILAGKNSGAQTVGVLCGFGEENELKRAGADLVLNCTTELTGFLPV